MSAQVTGQLGGCDSCCGCALAVARGPCGNRRRAAPASATVALLQRRHPRQPAPVVPCGPPEAVCSSLISNVWTRSVGSCAAVLRRSYRRPATVLSPSRRVVLQGQRLQADRPVPGHARQLRCGRRKLPICAPCCSMSLLARIRCEWRMGRRPVVRWTRAAYVQSRSFRADACTSHL